MRSMLCGLLSAFALASAASAECYPAVVARHADIVALTLHRDASDPDVAVLSTVPLIVAVYGTCEDEHESACDPLTQSCATCEVSLCDG